MIKQIIQDEQILRQKCEKATFEEAKGIVIDLIDTLNSRNENDVGLAAPQIGIQKQVCMIRTKTAIFLVNPQIIESYGETWYQEGCISFPGKSIRTKRFTDITVEVDYVGELDPAQTGDEINWHKNMILSFSKDNTKKMEDDINLLECVAVQHEISHLEGKLMFDYEWKNEPIKVNKKYGPNDKVTIKHPINGTIMENMKYKKIERFLQEGWIII